MTTLQVLIVLLGGTAATVFLALGWACFAIGKQMDSQADLPCCWRPDIVEREGQPGSYCKTCGISQPSPLEAAHRSSPGTKDKG